MIEITNLSKKFKDKSILNNINISMNKGKVYGFVGRNASGKTVFFKLLCGFLSPTEGKICIEGREIGKDIDFPEDCGVIIENPGFIDNISGIKNLKILADINKKIDEDKIRNTIKLVGLDPDDRRSVKNYSLGMKQKLAIAQAIMEDPKILVLDEPMNSLDEESVEIIRDIIIDMKNKGVTVLISSHIKEDIEVLCDEVFKVSNGKIEHLK